MTVRHCTLWRLGLCLVVALCGRLAAQDVNVARCGVAEQSTTGFGGDPARGNDGNTSGNYGDGSVTHTETGDPAPYWQLDLLDVYPLTRIVIWNRTDCCSERLNNFRVTVLDEDQNEVESIVVVEPPSPTHEIPLPVGTMGEFVRVEYDDPTTQDPAQAFISLAEVQVFTSGEGCTLPPVITLQPQSVRVTLGASHTFSVEVDGTAPFEYQWQKDGVDIAGATNPEYTIAAVSDADEADYTVTITNSAGEAFSDIARLTVVVGVNIAVEGVAAQSSTGYGGLPERAIDGNVDGNYGGNSVSHTADADPDPWWEVQLPAPSRIDAITIWNRTDCCQGRLTDFNVFALDAQRDILYEGSFFPFDFPDTSIEGFEVPLDEEIVDAQIVRVQFVDPTIRDPGQLYLSLAEVEVFGEITGQAALHPSLAHRAEATVTQSSTLDVFAAGRAVDDNLSTFTHTLAGDANATWTVDLGAVHPIEQIVVFNREDCCASRLRDITVSILGADGTTAVWTSELLNPENEIGGSREQIGPDRLALDLVELNGAAVQGRHVRIQRTPDPDLSGSGGTGNADEADVLSLGEVYVYSSPNCEQGDTHCQRLELISSPGEGLPGNYTFEVDGVDDDGDVLNVLYEIQASNGVTLPIVAGPATANRATFFLSFGSWTITSTVSNRLEHCRAQAPDATCSLSLEIPRDESNVALDPAAFATQSSTGYGGTAQRAIDGLTSGQYADGSVTHTTDGDPEPWWEVDLGATHAIDRIVLWNRTDCCANRLTNFRVSLLREDRSESYSDEHFTDPLGKQTFPDTTVEGYEIEVGGLEGQIVRVEFVDPSVMDPGQLYLSLAEVQVYREAGGPVEKSFVRGNADAQGSINITDGVFVLNFLFQGGDDPPCKDAADADDSGGINITDGVYILNFLFQGGPDPSAPYPDCGVDPAEDAVDCLTSHPACL